MVDISCCIFETRVLQEFHGSLDVYLIAPFHGSLVQNRFRNGEPRVAAESSQP